jgi:hypothetical protein
VAASVLSAEAFMSGASLAAHSSRTTKNGPWIFMARSENSKRTSQQRSSRGGPQEYGGNYGGGNDYDYSGGNLKYGTGKFTQRESSGGVNLSKNGRSMQDSVYREDRNNVDRARGRPRGDFESFGSRMDEIEDLERGMGRGGGRGGPRDRMMRGGGRGGGMDVYDMDDFSDGSGIRDRMGGSGLLRDMQDSGGRSRESYGYDDFGSPPKVMGGSSRGRGGGYRSNQFENSVSNERRRYEEYGHRMGEFGDDDQGRGNGIIDFESTGSRGGRRMNGGGGGASNFDRLMGRGGGRGGGRDHYDDHDGGDYEMEDMRRGGGSRSMEHREDYGGDFGGRGGGGGGLLRDMHR